MDPSLGIMWETGHFWVLIVYLFTAFDDITPAHLPGPTTLHPGAQAPRDPGAQAERMRKDNAF